MQIVCYAISFVLGFLVGWTIFKLINEEGAEEEEYESRPDFSREEKWKCFIDEEHGKKSQKCCNYCRHLLREPVSTSGCESVNIHRWHCKKLDRVVDETVSPIGVVTRPMDCPSKDV